MIKIDLPNSRQILDSHYNHFTVKKGREKTVLDFLDVRVSKSKGKVQEMYKTLRKKVEKDNNTGFSILTATPRELQIFRDDFEKEFGKILGQKSKKSKSKTITYRQDLQKVFYYSDENKWKNYAYELAIKLNINVCPYCNRSYTFTILPKDNIRGTRFEYDHFFSKSKYPYLALSLYNLIPSCHTCNSIKKEENFNLDNNIHPYLEGFSRNLVFTIIPKNIQFLNSKNSAYRIKFKKPSHSKWTITEIKSAFRNITTFRLTELYNHHKDYVNDLIKTSIVYNDSHIQDLLQRHQGTLFKNEDEVKQLIVGNYIQERDYSKRPLSKLTADLVEELRIFKGGIK